MNRNIRTMTRGMYDIQQLRIQMGNRIVMNFKAKELGQKPSEKESELDEKEQAVLHTLKVTYKKMMDGVKSFPSRNKFKGNEVISTYVDLCLMRSYMSLEDEEHMMALQLGHALKDIPIYTEFLEGIKGCGPLMSAVIVSEIDIHKAKYSSSLWMYCGLDVAPDGQGRSRKKEHLVESKYIDKNGNEKTKLGISFNPFIKTKLVGVLGSSFLKARSPYADVYYEYKNRLENHVAHKEKTPGHRHNMAMRYMIKRFLVDLYVKWREVEGLEVYPEYAIAKLGYTHGTDPSAESAQSGN